MINPTRGRPGMAPQQRGQPPRQGTLRKASSVLSQEQGPPGLRATLQPPTYLPRPQPEKVRQQAQKLTFALRNQIAPGLDKEKYFRIWERNPKIAQAVLNSVVKFPEFPVGSI